MLDRRDRKYRARRIGAGVVGFAVFVAAIWILRDVALLDRSQTSVIGGSGTTGPAQTGPAGTGPMISGESSGSVWLPPEGVEPSSPARGELLEEGGGIHPWHVVQVYADGRVIWMQQAAGTGWLERRLTPEAVDLVRSGALAVEDLDPPTHLPPNEWEDPDADPYVPSRYLVCADWSATMGLLPQAARDLLHGYAADKAIARGDEDLLWGGRGVACPVVTLEQARVLDGIFPEAGFVRGEAPWGLVYDNTEISTVGLVPLLPDGSFPQCCPG